MPVVAHTWRLMDQCSRIDQVILVVRDGMESAFAGLAGEFVRPDKPWKTAVGGRERQDSVWNGLEAIGDPDGLVAIQDGARPCTHPGHVMDCLEAALRTGAAVGAQRVTDTIKASDGSGFVAAHLDRSRLWAVQTPQCFRLAVIRRALAEVRQRGLIVTDDTAACEVIGQKVELVEGKWPNPKVTVPSDLPYIGLVLAGLRT